MPFKVGDRVTWTSQSQGYRKAKTGKVVEIVPATFKPTKCSNKPGIFRRNHESYSVKVGSKYYWPVVSLLHQVDGEHALPN